MRAEGEGHEEREIRPDPAGAEGAPAAPATEAATEPAAPATEPVGWAPPVPAAPATEPVGWTSPAAHEPAPGGEWVMPAAPAEPAPSWRAADSGTAPSWGGAPASGGTVSDPAAPVEGSGGPPPRRGVALVAGIVAALLLLGAGVGIGRGLRPATAPSVRPGPLGVVPSLTPSGGDNGGGLNLQAVASKVTPAVVDINTVIDEGSLGGGPGTGPVGQAAGTGSILTPDGEVLTNNHVIAGATSIRVTVQGRGSYTATVVGVDPADDIALLQIRGVSGLPTVALGDSSSLSVGQSVVAIGNALGRGGDPSVTQGTITALGRSIAVGGGTSVEHLHGLIESDASISPGDSGGTLVNSSGQVIGVITAAQSADRFQRASNDGFAIPIRDALDIVNKIRAGDESGTIIIGQSGFLGVQVQELNSTIAGRLGLTVDSGALVVGVVPGGPADLAGMPQYSVITSIDGRAIRSTDDLRPAIHAHDPGERLSVTWVQRDGSTHTATVRLVSGPAV